MNEFKPLNVIVIGAGSIGERHAKNLASLGMKVTLFDIDVEKSKKISSNYGFSMKTDLTTELLKQYDLALICTPTHHHHEPMKMTLEAGCHVFVEKPIAVKTSEELERINQLASNNGRITLVGCNMRFHAALQMLKKKIDSGELGKVYSAHVYFGQYLPSWRNVDYRQTYSAKADKGGGMLLECIHEFDYLCWLFGDVKEVYATANKFSDLDMDAEDLGEVILTFRNNIIAHIHMDCLQKTKRRGYEVICENKTIIWESVGNAPEESTIRILGKPEDLLIKDNLTINPNQMYIEEMKYLLKAIQKNDDSMNNISNAIKTLKLVEAAKESSRLKKTIVMG